VGSAAFEQQDKDAMRARLVFALSTPFVSLVEALVGKIAMSSTDHFPGDDCVEFHIGLNFFDAPMT
jgi:hypothetical protein